GPTHLEARRVQYCAEVSQLSLTPDATWRATPRRRFPVRPVVKHQAAAAEAEAAHGSPHRVLGAVLIYRARIPVPDTPDTARECNKCRAGQTMAGPPRGEGATTP